MMDFATAFLEVSIYSRYGTALNILFSIATVLSFFTIAQELKLPWWVAPLTFIPLFAACALILISSTILRQRGEST